MKTRLYFLDNLRAFVIFLVVLLHAALSYMAYAPEWWYVLDPQRSLFFTMVVLLVDVPIMQMMFFASGYFAMPSLVKRGAGPFLRDKFMRIGLPWIFGALVLAPPTAYLIYYTRNVPMSLGQFWLTDFWGPLFQQSVYWYLGVLFLFFALLALVYATNSRLQSWVPANKPPTWQLFVGFVLLTAVASLLLNLVFPLDTWYTKLYLIVFQPVRSPLYVSYFLLGVYAYQRGWFTAEGYKPNVVVWVLLFVFSGIGYLGYRMTIPEPMQTTIVLKAITALLFNLFCLSSLMAGSAVFQQYVNGSNAFWQSQSRSSYGIYFIHPLILYPMVYLFVPLTISIYLKATIVTLLAWLLSWGVSALVLTRAPGLRRIF